MITENYSFSELTNRLYKINFSDTTLLKAYTQQEIIQATLSKDLVKNMNIAAFERGICIFTAFISLLGFSIYDKVQLNVIRKLLQRFYSTSDHYQLKVPESRLHTVYANYFNNWFKQLGAKSDIFDKPETAKSISDIKHGLCVLGIPGHSIIANVEKDIITLYDNSFFTFEYTIPETKTIKRLTLPIALKPGVALKDKQKLIDLLNDFDKETQEISKSNKIITMIKEFKISKNILEKYEFTITDFCRLINKTEATKIVNTKFNHSTKNPKKIKFSLGQSLDELLDDQKNTYIWYMTYVYTLTCILQMSRYSTFDIGNEPYYNLFKQNKVLSKIPKNIANSFKSKEYNPDENSFKITINTNLIDKSMLYVSNNKVFKYLVKKGILQKLTTKTYDTIMIARRKQFLEKSAFSYILPCKFTKKELVSFFNSKEFDFVKEVINQAEKELNY